MSGPTDEQCDDIIATAYGEYAKSNAPPNRIELERLIVRHCIAAERERAARVCEGMARKIGWPTERWPADECAAAIRAGE